MTQYIDNFVKLKSNESAIKLVSFQADMYPAIPFDSPQRLVLNLEKKEYLH